MATIIARNLFIHRLVPCGTRLFTVTSQIRKLATLFERVPLEEISPKNEHPIAGRKFLPGSDEEGLPKYLNKPREGFPHALRAVYSDQLSISQWAQACRQTYEDALPKYGALLIRGLPVYSAEDFAGFSTGLGYESMPYIGGVANRRVVNKEANVYTTNDDPSQYTIELHNEMTYHTTYPGKLVMFCLQQPSIEESGGFTVLCDSRELMERLDPSVIAKLDEKGLRYIHKMPDQSRTAVTSGSWQQVLNTTDKKVVEEFLEAGGWEYSWDPKLNRLTYWNTLPAFRAHPNTGEKLWFNQATIHHISALKAHPAYPGDDKQELIYVNICTYGDGSEIEPEVIRHIRSCAWHSSVGFQWRDSDVLMLDNFTVLHGRLGFTGERRIIASLVEPRSWSPQATYA